MNHSLTDLSSMTDVVTFCRSICQKTTTLKWRGKIFAHVIVFLPLLLTESSFEERLQRRILYSCLKSATREAVCLFVCLLASLEIWWNHFPKNGGNLSFAAFCFVFMEAACALWKGHSVIDFKWWTRFQKEAFIWTFTLKFGPIYGCFFINEG